MNKKIILTLVIGISILVWLLNSFSSRLNSLEQRVQFNNNMIREIHTVIERQDTMIGDIEDNLARWIEIELGKIHSRLNKLP